MPYQNKVDPWGNIQAVSSRGMFLGNRGVLHNEHQEIVTTHRIKGWVTCILQFKDRHREIMTPKRYTELFFLDEATAFSAGHRPCAECRRKRFNEFKSAWFQGNESLLKNEKLSAPNMDKAIHEERIFKKEKVTFNAKLSSLPTGTIIQIRSAAFLLWNHNLYHWSYSGYTEAKIAYSWNEEVIVLTPKSYVKTFSNGFVPEVHESIKRL